MPRVVHADSLWRRQSKQGWRKRIKVLEAMLERYDEMPSLTVRQQAAVIDATAEIARLKLHLKVS